jgi:hypothetical protein
MKIDVTPIIFGFFGALIVIVAIINNVPDNRFTQVLGISGAFVAGAAGLSQTAKENKNN